MVSDPSFELVTIFSMTLSVQYFSYVQHIGNTTVHIPIGVLFKYMYVLLKYIGVLFKYMCVLLKYIGVLFKYMYVLLKYIGVLFKYMYVLLKYIGVLHVLE
jgi:hypothetical protein